MPDVGTAYVTSTLSLECLPPDGYPMVNVTWYRNGIKIRQVENPQFINFSNSRRKLVLGPLFVNFTGSYHCQAANEANRGSPLKSEPLQITVTCESGQRVVGEEVGQRVLGEEVGQGVVREEVAYVHT